MPRGSCPDSPNTVSDGLHCTSPVGMAENRRTRHQNGRTGIDHRRSGARINAAVHFNLHVDTSGSDQLGDLTNLRHNRFYELLRGEAGVHGHHQNVVAKLDRRRQRLGRRGGVDGDARLRSAVADALQSALQMTLGFDVNRDHVRAGVEERADVELRLLDHQMTVERQRRRLADGLHDHRSDRQVRHEVAVHHIEVQEVGAGFDVTNLVAELREVSGKNRWRDLDRHWVVVPVPGAGGRAGCCCSMMPLSSCLLTTTVIASRALTGAPRSGNWRMIMPSAIPGYASNFTVNTFNPCPSRYGRASSSG